jgi:hypothetical protein
MHDRIATLITGTYTERGMAEEDLELLLDDSQARPFRVVDATIVFEDTGGHVTAAKRPRRRRRREGVAARGREIGVHLRRGLWRHDVREAAEVLGRSPVALVAVTEGPGAEGLATELHCGDVVFNRVKTVDLSFRRLLAG